MSFYKKMPLVVKLILAVTLGIVLGSFLPTSIIRAFVTFSSIFSSFLGFAIPLIIVVNFLDFLLELPIFLHLSLEHLHS